MTKLPDQLLGGRIIAKPIKKEEEQVGSLVIPSTANAALESATVVMADKDIHQYIKKGDTVVFATGSGLGQLIEGEAHLWLGAGEIWAVHANPLSVVKDEQTT